MLRRLKEVPVVLEQHERISHTNPNKLLYESPHPGILRFARSQALLIMLLCKPELALSVPNLEIGN
jgi:hypothetical protein